MTVYIEANFVLEQALQQEQSEACDSIVGFAISRAIALVVPAFSLAEPHQALALKEKARRKLSNELQAHVVELGRSKPYRGVPDDFTILASVLIGSAEQEREGLQRALSGLLSSAEIIPLDSEILMSGSELQVSFKDVRTGRDRPRVCTQTSPDQ